MYSSERRRVRFGCANERRVWLVIGHAPRLCRIDRAPCRGEHEPCVRLGMQQEDKGMHKQSWTRSDEKVCAGKSSDSSALAGARKPPCSRKRRLSTLRSATGGHNRL